MIYIVNCNKIKNINQFHDEVKKVFNIPDYYGINLDALLDVLRDITDNFDLNTFISINFIHFSNLISVLEPDLLIQIMLVFDFWKSEYPAIKIKIAFEL